jgi:serine/threonine protein kinase
MEEAECRHWFTQVLAGLSYLQSRYICHRDMSLENVLLDGDTSKVGEHKFIAALVGTRFSLRGVSASRAVDHRLRPVDWYSC